MGPFEMLKSNVVQLRFPAFDGRIYQADRNICFLRPITYESREVEE